MFLRGMMHVYKASHISCEAARREMEMCRCTRKHSSSIDCFFQFLHWEALHGLASWLGFEDAWLLGERIDTLACWFGWLLLQLHVENTGKLESTILLEFSCSQLNVTSDDGLHLLWFQFSTLGNS